MPSGEEASCVFCKIVRRELPASLLAEDEHSLAFLDIRPINPGHFLVVPKRHAARLQDLAPGDGGRVFEMARGLALALYRSGVRCEGVNLHLADGEVAGQEIFHVHLHAYPRFAGDGVGLRMGPRYGSMPKREELDKLAEAIRTAAGHR
ncbi:MAG TPA: HIT family protein [Thermoplasmata archaeon]|nr:HIT family protein [Thermoplasmata archaeon]